jgi:enoyl-CoA hydratase/carnithine racemase
VYSTLQAGADFLAWRQAATATRRDDTDAPVVVDRDGVVLRITLNRPTRHNAVTVALRDALVEALTVALVDDSVERVELSGRGPSFCSGGDLGEFGSFPDPAIAHVTRLARSPARLLHLLRDRLRVSVHGSCLGAGVEWPAFAGHVSAHADAMFGLPEVPLGLVPGAGGTASIPRRIGRQRTMALALSGVRIDAPTALAWGLIDAIA